MQEMGEAITNDEVEWWCPNCGATRLNKSWRCAQCNSDELVNENKVKANGLGAPAEE